MNVKTMAKQTRGDVKKADKCAEVIENAFEVGAFGVVRFTNMIDAFEAELLKQYGRAFFAEYLDTHYQEA